MASKITKHFHYSFKPNLLIFLLLFLFLLFIFTSNPTSPPHNSPIYKTTPKQHSHDYCTRNKIAPFYIYPLPPRFNDALLLNCRSLNVYTDMCPHVAHGGLGRPLNSTWHATHQLMAEMVFHARAERHPCRTFDAGVAEIFYVPFYAGLYASSVVREANYTVRDGLGVEVGEYVVGGPHWGRASGRDHFMVVGRTSWDFMRLSSEEGADDFGANRMLLLSPVRTSLRFCLVELVFAQKNYLEDTFVLKLSSKIVFEIKINLNKRVLRLR